jgi:hypothetical protein
VKQIVDERWEAMMANDPTRARDLCAAVVVEARMLRHQIGIQHDSSNQS